MAQLVASASGVVLGGVAEVEGSNLARPRPLTNDLWVFLFQTIDAEYVK